MAKLTVQDLPEAVLRALHLRADQRGRSAEAEACAILTAAVQRDGRVRMGDALAALGQEMGLTEDDLQTLEQARDRTAAQPLKFD